MARRRARVLRSTRVREHRSAVPQGPVAATSTDAPVLSRRALNRALLARQLLLRRERLSVADAIDRLAGLQAQYSPSPYIGLWSRVYGFEKDLLTHALERRSVVKATLMRGTLHLLSAEDYLAFAGAWHAARWQDVRTRFRTSGLDFDRIAERVVELAREQPRTRSALRALLAPELAGPVPETHYDWVLRGIAALVHVPPSGTWRYHADARLVPAEDWLGRPLGDEEQGLVLMVRRYLAAFGPAAREDIETWSYLKRRPIDRALAALEPLERYRDEQGRTLFDLPGAPIPPEETRPPVRFLPKWDNILIGFRDRTRIVPEEHYAAVMRPRNADVLATVLVGGFVAAAWRVERDREGATLVIEPLERIPEEAHAEMLQEAERLVRFVEPDARDWAVTVAHEP